MSEDCGGLDGGSPSLRCYSAAVRNEQDTNPGLPELIFQEKMETGIFMNEPTCSSIHKYLKHLKILSGPYKKHMRVGFRDLRTATFNLWC